MFHVEHCYFIDFLLKTTYYFICATYILEIGQDRKIAALIIPICVHFFIGGFMNKYMNIAVNQAKIAKNKGNTPVGAIIVKNNKIISKAYNKKNSDNISIYHAEILCIIKACKKLKTWRLDDCEMYVTLEPCKMCISAIAESRIKKVYYILSSNYKKVEKANFNNINSFVYNDDYDYKKLLSSFFENRR